MIKVELKFDKMITSLSGNRFGREVYKEQIEDVLTEQGVSAVLPEYIEDIASSFYEGLFASLNEKYGTEKAHELLRVYTQNEFLKSKMHNIRETYGV